MRAEIDRVIALQEEIGLDVLVHGEPERNDMVQYFAEQPRRVRRHRPRLGPVVRTRYVRPPILHGDVSRPGPITVGWARYAQSRTSKPVKGMLTGPVTMLAWSFVRADQPLGETARQVALAVRDEIADLEAAGIRIIQVDEPALRELMPLRRADRDGLPGLGGRRVPAGHVRCGRRHPDSHPHVLQRVRRDHRRHRGPGRRRHQRSRRPAPRMEFMADLSAAGYARGIGPGVWDIHSPRVPDVAEMAEALDAGAERHRAGPALGQPGLRPEDPRLRRDRGRAAEPGRGRPRGARRARGLTGTQARVLSRSAETRVRSIKSC